MLDMPINCKMGLGNMSYSWLLDIFHTLQFYIAIPSYRCRESNWKKNSIFPYLYYTT